MTIKIKVKTLTINKNENMTDWKEKEYCFYIKFDKYNKTFILKLTNTHTYDGTSDKNKELT